MTLILKLSDDIAWKTRTFCKVCNYDVFLPQQLCCKLRIPECFKIRRECIQGLSQLGVVI